MLLLALLFACPRSTPPQVDTTPAWPEGPDHLYVVQWGDTLEWIAQDWGVPGGYPALAAHNDLWDPDWIGMGQELRIPHTPQAAASLPLWPKTEPWAGHLADCPTQRWAPEPVQTWLAGCEASACTDLDGGVAACACYDPGGSRVIITQGGAEVQSWPVTLEREPGTQEWDLKGTVSDLRATAADLDRDGRDEWLVLSLRQANDVGMRWYDAALLDDPGRPALTFALDQGGVGSFVAAADGGCDLLATEWDIDDEEARPWPGHYLTGRVLRFDGSSLSAVAGAPVLARRLYYTYELPQPATPAADLNHHSTLARLYEPEVTWQLLGSMGGSIQGTTEVRDRWNPTLTVQLDSGAVPGVTRVCDGAAGICLPKGLVPRDPAWELGRGATVSTYLAGSWGAESRVLWLAPR